MGFKIIPQIDKNPRLIAFVQTPLGKVFVLVWFAIGLLCFTTVSANVFVPFLEVPQWQMVLLVVSLVTFFPKQREEIVISATVFFWIFLDKIFEVSPNQQDIIKRLVTANGGTLPEPYFLFKLAVVGVVSCACIAYLYFIHSGKLKLKRPIVAMFVFYLACLLLGAQLDLSRGEAIFAWASIFFFRKIFWFLAYAIVDRGVIRQKSLAKQVGLFFPFWTVDIIPMKGNAELESREAGSAQEFAVTQLKGLKLVFWCTFVLLLYRLFDFFVFHSCPLSPIGLGTFGLSLPHLTWLGFGTYNELHLPWYYNWISICALQVKFITFTGVDVFGYYVVIAHMVGYRLFRYNYRPFESNSFNDFFRRIMYYYNEMLVNFFFFPAWNQTRIFRRHKNFRIFLATFLTVLVGGTLFHFTRDAYDILQLGFSGALIQFATGSLPYFAALGLVSGLFAMHRPRFHDRLIFRLANVAGIFLLFCLVVSLVADFRLSSLHDKVVFLGSVFGLDVPR